MKKTLLFFAIVLGVNFSFSQTDDFTIGLLLPPPTQKINDAQIVKLESRLTVLINNSGVVKYGYSNDFVISPSVNVDDTSAVQGGLENITVTTIDLTLNLLQISSGKSFSAISKRIKGSGKTEQQAITNAFSSIKSNDKDLLDFISKGKESIYKYYKDNCVAIQNKAAQLYSKKDFEQAISLLQSIPQTGNSCYEEAQKNVMAYYNDYQSKLCSQNIIKAKSEIAISNYENALSYLNMIDESSSCYSEVEKLINQISDKISSREKKETDLEIRRLNAIKEIAKAYYSGR